MQLIQHRSGAYFGQANNSLEATENQTNSPPLSSDDSDIDLRKLNLSRFNNTTNLFRRLTNINDETLNASHSDETKDGPPKLTFDQYVKKLTGNYTVKTEAANANTQSSLATALLNTGGRLSLKVAPAPSSASLNSTNANGASSKLAIPVINPAIKAALGKFSGATKADSIPTKTVSQLTVNKILNINATGSSNGQSNSHQNSTLKLITVNSQVGFILKSTSHGTD